MKLTLLLGLLAFAAAPVLAQAPAVQNGKIQGHVINPTGAPQSGGTISLSADGGRTSKYTFEVGPDGAFSGEAAPGTYTMVFRQKDTPPDKMVDQVDNVKIEAGQTTSQDDDMSRQAYIDKLPEEEKKQLEEIRKHNSEALKANEIIKNLNNDLKQVSADIHEADTSKDKDVKKTKYTDIETLMQKDTAVRPTEPVLWAYLGSGAMNLGNLDPTNSKDKYDQAEAAYKKAIELSQASKNPKPEILGMAHSGLGEIYARQGKVPEANAEFTEAAKADPPKAAMYLKNEAVIFSQAGNPDAQAAAADEAIKANPNDPILYYLKGQALVGKATMAPDPKNPKVQRIVLPPGCAEAYQKYLELAPDGPYAPDVAGILQQAGEKVSSSYKAPKKGK
jgi:tetratricopeptide (TPR) repeat protein